MVHLHFTEPVRRAGLYAVVASSEKVAIGPPSSRALGEDLLKIRHAGPEISDDFRGLPASSVLNLASALPVADCVLRSIMSAQRSREAARMGVGVGLARVRVVQFAAVTTGRRSMRRQAPPASGLSVTSV